MVQFVVDAFGTAVGVKCDPQARGRLMEQWNRCLTDREPETTVTHTGGDLTNAADYSLSSTLTVAAISAQSGQLLMFHACGLADPQSGRVAVLVAQSGTGKTTASIRLSQAGLGYVSDETIAIDDDLSVRRYPKPLSIVDDPGFPYEKSQHSPDDLGMAPLNELPLTAAAVVLLNRDREGASEPALSDVDLIDGLVRVIPQTSALPSLRDPLAKLATAVESIGGLLELTYSEIHEAKALLTELLSAPPRSSISGFSHHPATNDLTTDGAPVQVTPPERVGAVRRAPYLDAISQDGRVLLLVGTSCLVLDGPGAVLWLAANEKLAIAEAVRRSRELLGDHPDADSLVHAAALELISHGILLPVDEPPVGDEAQPPAN
ncbi:hypothetical protein IEE94_09880 [Yimella sp. cx-573]|nr:hypothetical protein [Yimella sp. cx-573]